MTVLDDLLDETETMLGAIYQLDWRLTSVLNSAFAVRTALQKMRGEEGDAPQI